MNGRNVYRVLPRVSSLFFKTNGAYLPWTVTLSISQPYSWVHRTIRYPKTV